MERVNLGEYIEINTGKLDANKADKNGKYPFFTCSNEPLKINQYSYDCECVLVAGNGDLNVKYYYGKFDAYQRTYIIRPKNIAKLDTKYLYYLMDSNIEQLRRNAIGGVIKYIKLKNLTDIKFQNISIMEQKNIVTQLDKVQEIIDKRKEQIEELNQLIQIQFVQMFGDPIENPKNNKIVKLSDIAKYWNGLTYKPTDVNKEGTIVLRSSNIQNSQLDYENLVRVNCNIKDKQYVKDNDILMCSRNGSAKLVGKVAVIKNTREKMTFGAFMMIIRSEYYPYLFSYFQTDAFRNQIKSGATTTINQITGNMLNRIKLPLPDRKDIEQFAKIVNQIDKQKVEMQKSLKEMQQLKESLMNQYFGF